MITNAMNLVGLALLGLLLLRATVAELQRRRRLEWRLQILELLATAVRRGRSLAPVLERAAFAEPSRLATICRDLAARLAEGLPLSRALCDVAPDCFPTTCIATIAGAEGSGALADALEDLVSRTDDHQALAHRMRLAFTYPLILAIYYAGSHTATWRIIGWQQRALGESSIDSGTLVGWTMLGLLILVVVKPQALMLSKRSLGRWRGWCRDRIAARTKTGRLLAASDFLAALSHVVAAGIALPAAIRRVAGTVGNERLERDLAGAVAALDEGADAEVAWRRTFLPEFAIVSIAAVRSSPGNQAEAMRHAAAECRRRWLHRRERTLAVMPLVCVAVIGTLLAIDFGALQQMLVHVSSEVQLW